MYQLIAAAGLTGLQLLSSKNQADMLQRQADFEAQQLQFNSELISIQEKELQVQAERDIKSRSKQVKRMLGQQKTSLAAQGLEVDGDLALDLMNDEKEFGQEDIAAIRNNAWRQGMGLKIQEGDLKSRADFTRLQGDIASRSTLATGGLSAAGSILPGLSRTFGR